MSAALSYQARTTKAKFEAKLCSEFNPAHLAARKYTEFNIGKQKNVSMTLYYLNGTHIGTHCGGEAWIFESAKAVA